MNQMSTDAKKHAPLPYYTLENALKQILPNETKQWEDDIRNSQMKEEAKDAIQNLRQEGFIARPLVTEVGEFRLALCRCDLPYNPDLIHGYKHNLAVLISKDLSKNIVFTYGNFLGEYLHFPKPIGDNWDGRFYFWIPKKDDKIFRYGIEVNHLNYPLWKHTYYSVRYNKKEKVGRDLYLMYGRSPGWDYWMKGGNGTNILRGDFIVKNLITAITNTPKNCEIKGVIKFEDDKNNKLWQFGIENEVIFFRNFLTKNGGNSVPRYASEDEKKSYKREMADNSIQWESDHQSGESILITSNLFRYKNVYTISTKHSVVDDLRANQ